MSILGNGWRPVYATLCVCVQLIGVARAMSVYVVYPGIYDSKAIGTEHVSAGTAAQPVSFMGQKLIPIKGTRMNSNLALPLEPDAEMLPAHYERVQPPGVDHMEMRYAETQISNVAPKHHSSKGSNSVGQAVQSSGKRTSGTKNQGNEGQKTESVEYVAAGGMTNTRDVHDEDTKRDSKKGKGKEGASRGEKSAANADRLTTGYRNVYHKDEYKKNHDYYDNDDHGGHSSQHGRYNERHVATEGTYKKGDAARSNHEQNENREQVAAIKSQVARKP